MAQQSLLLNGRVLPTVGKLSECGVKDNDMIVVRRTRAAHASTSGRAATPQQQAASSQNLAAILSQSLAGMMQSARKSVDQMESESESCLFMTLFVVVRLHTVQTPKLNSFDSR